MTRLLTYCGFVALVSALVVAAAAGSSRRVVLGAASYAGPNGAGWGKPHPKRIYNGGDPSGLIRHVHWISWGGAVARGHGRHAIFKPHGGYYRKLVRIQLRAYDLGRCTRHGPLAYRRLSFREPSRPGGPVGRWHWWSGSKTICRFAF
jgi:hypothetical protein